MLLGLIFAISACFVWGAIFVIPEFLSDYSALEVVIGRYFIYGILSLILLCRKGISQIRQIPKYAWVMAFIFALFSNIFYYIGIIAGIRYASASLTVLIIGMAPILIALYGNWHAREIPFKQLVFPCVWIGAGLILVNVAEVDWSFTEYTLRQYIFGVFGVLFALISWSWYAVHNARFLKRNPQIPSTDWATVIGVCTLFWALLISIVYGVATYKEAQLPPITHLTKESWRFFIGVAILGILCSWLGCFLWNRASMYLPVSLMGPFLIFESLFGLLFVYLSHFRLPSLMEIIGIVSMLGGIILSIFIFRRQKYKV